MKITKEEYKKMLRYRTPVKTYTVELSYIGKQLSEKPRTFSIGGDRHPVIEAMRFNHRTKRVEVFGEPLIIEGHTRGGE